MGISVSKVSFLGVKRVVPACNPGGGPGADGGGCFLIALASIQEFDGHYGKDVGPGCWKLGSMGLVITYPKNPDPSLE